MNRIYKTALCSCLALALFPLQKSQAGVEENSARQNPSQFHLRCWQNGRLLFEETGLDAKFTSQAKFHSVDFKKTQDENSPVQLLEMGESICLYKKYHS